LSFLLRKMGVKLEEGLTQRILDDVKQEPGNLPLLEFALTATVGKAESGTIDASGILRDWGSGKGTEQSCRSGLWQAE
jgi:hypothetical protein